MANHPNRSKRKPTGVERALSMWNNNELYMTNEELVDLHETDLEAERDAEQNDCDRAAGRD